LGFDICRCVRADQSLNPAQDQAALYLDQWIKQGAHGDMEWMAQTQERRSHPQNLWPDVRSIIMLGMNYGPDQNPLHEDISKQNGVISVYARHRDYHDVIKGKLKMLATWMRAHMQRMRTDEASDFKVFVDTAPVMEKPLAQHAGLGWAGKHTNVVSREFGSWLFLGSIFTTLDLEADEPEHDHCGSCRACLDICPTQAFPAPYQLDARLCISYLTIEHKGTIERSLRSKIGNRIYGCDDCLAVCPWNKYAQQARETKLQARPDLSAPSLAQLVQMDDAQFRHFFAGGPIKRIGHERFLRNVLIAIGNSGDGDLSAVVLPHLMHSSPLVRAVAVWALSRLVNHATFTELRAVHLSSEDNEDVQVEWRSYGALT